MHQEHARIRNMRGFGSRVPWNQNQAAKETGCRPPAGRLHYAHLHVLGTTQWRIDKTESWNIS